MKFTQLAIGQAAIVTDLNQLPVVLRRRLNSMGFIEGVHCYIHNRSILGGPLTIAYNKQVISLRKQDVALIGVKLA
jgi:Fe2+ transport system protein FeoA